jgi:hypothetical protein
MISPNPRLSSAKGRHTRFWFGGSSWLPRIVFAIRTAWSSFSGVIPARANFTTRAVALPVLLSSLGKLHCSKTLGRRQGAQIARRLAYSRNAVCEANAFGPEARPQAANRQTPDQAGTESKANAVGGLCPSASKGGVCAEDSSAAA